MADTIKPNQAGIGKKPKGSGFTNISKMLDANKNNQLGSTVASGVSGTADKAKSTLAGAQQDFQSGLVSNRIGDDDEKSLVTAGLDAAKSGQVSDAQAQGFAKIYGGYKGPTSLKDEEAVSAQAQSAQALGQNTQSRGGRQELLTRFAARPQASYTQGQKRLDELLLGQTGAKDIQAARRQTVGLADQAANAAAQARLDAGKEANDARTYAEDVKKQLGDASKGINDAAAGAATAQQTENEAIANLATGNMSVEDFASKYGSSNPSLVSAARLAKDAGFSPAEIGSYLSSAGVVDPSGNQFMTAQQAASLNALAKLSGQEGTAKAGSYSKAALDTEKFISGLTGKATQREIEKSLADQERYKQQGIDYRAAGGFSGTQGLDAEARKAGEELNDMLEDNRNTANSKGGPVYKPYQIEAQRNKVSKLTSAISADQALTAAQAQQQNAGTRAASNFTQLRKKYGL